jgi:receptor-type tyrosine-protein phosphatase gamma
VKCEKYWPEAKESAMFGDISIRCTKENVFPEYTKRFFRIKTMESDERKVLEKIYVLKIIVKFLLQIIQMHYTAWPDHGVPQHPHSLANFAGKVLKIKTQQPPIVVHCRF